MQRKHFIAHALLVAVVTASALGAEATTRRYVRTDGVDEFTQKISLLGSVRGTIKTPNSCKDPLQPCATIQNAIQKSANGDRIHVAAGNYNDGVFIYADRSPAFPEKKDLVIKGSYSADFKHQDYPSHGTQIYGATRLIAAWGAEIDITFANINFRSNDRSPIIEVSAGTRYMDYSFVEALARQGQAKLTLRHVSIINVMGPSVDASAGRFGVVELNLIDAFVLQDGSIRASAIAYDPELTGEPPALLPEHPPEFSHLTLDIRGSDFWSAGGDDDAGAQLKVSAEGRGAEALADVAGSYIVYGDSNGGVWAYSSLDGTVSLDIENSVIAANDYSGIRATGPGTKVTLLNDTISQNGGYAVRAEGSSSVELRNSIARGTEGSDNTLITILSRDYAIVRAGHSDTGRVSNLGGNFRDLGGNVNVDPGLGDSACCRQYPEFHLRPDSPLIDRGQCYLHENPSDPRNRVAPYDDIDGEVRPMGSGCEIGADEVDPS